MVPGLPRTSTMKAASRVAGGAEGLAVVRVTAESPMVVMGETTEAELMGPEVFQNSTLSWAETAAEAEREMRAS